MMRIRNTSIKNVWGEGYEQEVTLENGEQYAIKNTPTKNVWGEGYEKEIIKKNSTSDDSIIGLLIQGVVIVIFMLFLWLVFINL